MTDLNLTPKFKNRTFPVFKSEISLLNMDQLELDQLMKIKSMFRVGNHHQKNENNRN